MGAVAYGDDVLVMVGRAHLLMLMLCGSGVVMIPHVERGWGGVVRVHTFARTNA